MKHDAEITCVPKVSEPISWDQNLILETKPKEMHLQVTSETDTQSKDIGLIKSCFYSTQVDSAPKKYRIWYNCFWSCQWIVASSFSKLSKLRLIVKDCFDPGRQNHFQQSFCWRCAHGFQVLDLFIHITQLWREVSIRTPSPPWVVSRLPPGVDATLWKPGSTTR